MTMLPHMADATMNRISEIGKPAAAIPDRIEYIRNAASGKRVLDVGVVDHNFRAAQSGSWLHRQVRDAADYSLGIDILREDIEALRSKGFNVAIHDLCQAPLDDIFDLIVMGELIEHVSDAQSLLINARASMHERSQIIITTPNPWYINYLRMARRYGYALDNVDHVAWFDPATMYALASRCRLRMSKFAGLKGMVVNSIKGRAAAWSVNMAASRGVFPLANCKSILYELEAA